MEEVDSGVEEIVEEEEDESVLLPFKLAFKNLLPINYQPSAMVNEVGANILGAPIGLELLSLILYKVVDASKKIHDDSRQRPETLSVCEWADDEMEVSRSDRVAVVGNLLDSYQQFQYKSSSNLLKIILSLSSCFVKKLCERNHDEKDHRQVRESSVCGHGRRRTLQSDTIEEVFRDFKGRHAGMIKELTSDVEEFYQQCDPD